MISPVTMQMTIPMTNDMANVQNQENSRATTEHMQFADANEKNVNKQQETVVEKDTAEFSQYQYDAREKGNNEYSGNSKKRKKKKDVDEESESESKEAQPKEKKGHVVQIDIKL